MKLYPHFSLRAVWLALALAPACAALAAASSGTIEGRVLNSARGEYVERVRVTVEGAK